MSRPVAGAAEGTASAASDCHHLLDHHESACAASAPPYASATLRSTTSGHSSRTSSTTVCDSPGAGGEDGGYFDDEEISHEECCLRGATTVADDLDDRLRYSFKGPPPELYSPKKDFISKGPLLDRQLVLKKRCEWWFYRYKCSQKMSTHWRQHGCLYACLTAFLLAMVFMFLHGMPSAHRTRLELAKNNYTDSHHTLIPTTLPPLPSGDAESHPHRHFDNDTNAKDTGEAGGFDDLGEEDLTAFVMPTKVYYNYSLSEDDLLYESKRNSDINSLLKDSSSAFSMTGTFRSRHNEIWDPHPQYNLNVFGRQLHLVLRQDASFIHNHTIHQLRILKNETLDTDEFDQVEQELEQGLEAEQRDLDCHYTGYVEGDPNSMVAVSLCSGMTGYIKTSFGALLIEPVNRTSSDEVLHRVWRKSLRHARQAVTSFELGMDALMSMRGQSQLKERSQGQDRKLRRRKRHYNGMESQFSRTQEYTLEVLIAVDSSMHRFHQNRLESYVLILMSIVSSIFKDASIGSPIHITLVNLIVLPENNDRHNSSNQMLKHFCSFINQKGYHRDTAMLITREPICGGIPGRSCHMLGLAELGTVCNPRSCSIVQDTGLPAAFTMAHELGHILNMHHDDDPQCQPFNSRHGNKEMHIMSSVMGVHMHPWSWSRCSRHYVSEFLESLTTASGTASHRRGDKSCLENEPELVVKNTEKRQPGEIYSLDNQCQLIFGTESRHCPMEEQCQRLWCNRTHSNPRDQCRSSNLPWADGTTCSHRNSDYWCQKGKCVPRQGSNRLTVNGGWGNWSPWTPCSLTCGGGVQESRRECNNPVPEHGGKYCLGARKKYTSCNVHSCPSGSMDSREQQCYEMNGRNLNIPGITPDTKWLPKYEREPCKLFCRMENSVTYFMLKNKVTDGTSCTVDSFDKCVNGICRPAGCDNELNSIAKLDRCGVCEGRNDTCHEVTGNFLVSDLLRSGQKSNFYVTTIPKGASNIVITQPGYPEHHYIALSDDKGNGLLNQDVLKTFFYKFVYAGVTVEYSGPKSPVERVNTTYSWKLSRDLIVKIISLNLSVAKNKDTVMLSYSYTVDRPALPEAEVEIYRWEMSTWSTCDSLCEGRSYRNPACVSTTQGLKVAPQFCDKSAMPKVEDRGCNTDCRLNLTVTSISECSASCGERGTREKNFNCIQTFPSIQRSNIVDMSYCKLKFDVVHHEECREGCWNFSEWSSCSKSCGTGTQQREAHCYLHNTRVSDDLCNPRTRPQTDLLTFCNTEPCPTYTESPNAIAINNWVIGDWGECNEWCEKSRSVSCSHPYAFGCQTKKPKEVRKCCHIKYTSEWTQCSVQCGEGKKWKKQTCSRVYKPEIQGAPKRREPISETYCISRKVRRPTLRTTTKTCRINCKWNVSDWTRCPADCSEEYQSRYVRCEAWQDKRSKEVAEDQCDAKKRPTKRRICNNCVRRQSKVIMKCNCDGIERRRDTCFDSHKRRVSCPSRSKVERRCTPPPYCRRRIAASSMSSLGSRSSGISVRTSHRRPRSCRELREMHGIDKDGEYQLEVRSRLVRVYCHEMRSHSPREYVNVDPQENYSIYYEYRTQLTNSCPPESRSHEYLNDQNSGRTHFSKLRLNITDLRILDNDFEFAQSRGQPQKLGSAGDCYNRNRQCPQGDFAINLEKTDFTMRPGTVWSTHGQSAVMKQFDNTAVMRRAFCGGYCGGCFIALNSGLYLDVL
ncbi:hypothetical protein KR038_008664 [Drosophila bunnanda]|nr:hypothetical protein KR038_008664 [Drosophila bunnanda]